MRKEVKASFAFVDMLWWVVMAWLNEPSQPL